MSDQNVRSWCLGGGESLRHFIDYWAGRGAWDGMDETLRAQIRRSAQKIVLDFEVAFTDADLAGLRGLTCPVRLLSGGRSRLPARRIASFLAELWPAAKLEVVADANHLLPVTHPGMLAAFLGIGGVTMPRIATDRLTVDSGGLPLP